MATTVHYYNTKSSGDVKPTIKLDEVDANEGHYEVITRDGDMEETYQKLETDRKVNSDKIGMSKEKLDKTKLVIVLLCCVVSGLVVAVVSLNVVIFSILVTNGDWTSWGDWGACSVTCGIGITTRIRTCSNPRPSTMGQYCEGNSEQVQICNDNACSGIGQWSEWEKWSECSTTCQGALRTRLRKCTVPVFTLDERACNGSSSQIEICNVDPCIRNSNGFSVHGPNTTSTGHPLTFETELYNDSDLFNMTTGIFVCKQEGLYFFISTTLRNAGNSRKTGCSFYKNDVKTEYFFSFAATNDTRDFPSDTRSILYNLKQGDYVYLGSCFGVSNMAFLTSFTGFLVSSVY
ncbi:uncharacterized protein LOC128551141 [Mercenaria mercenaria]|uniref:uncharacterized protein LOC128551141 n=1 Tax=Mercenaria mercenaria TaxID=6596 RepID=UPI00234E994A|nr:uncharacterized protein LOC128551141 [Mercenaria mercenaria]